MTDNNEIETVARAIAANIGINWDAKNIGETSNGCTPAEDREYCLSIAKDAIFALDLEAAETLRIENKRLKAAFWMVGNNDTPQDVAAWWRQFGDMWTEMFSDDTEKEKAQKTADNMWKQI